MKKAPKLSLNILYIMLLSLGFVCLIIPSLFDLRCLEGLISALWIGIFITLTDKFRTPRHNILSGAVFCTGYFLRFLGATGTILFDFALFFAIGLILYSVFILYALILNRRNKFTTTLAFPILWTLVYFVTTLIDFPTPVRIDVLFANNNILIQSESLIGSLGLEFALLWIIALFHFSICNRHAGISVLTSAILLLLFVPGLILLYPNPTSTETVRIAYTTGPYSGDFRNYISPGIEACIKSMERSARKASEDGAKILVFNEEAFQMTDSEEPGFLEKCCLAARENKIHMLVGLDIDDTDNSDNGKSQNKLVWIDSCGQILDSYLKSHLIPVIEDSYVKGNDVIPSHTISIDGKTIKVSYLICYDSNFPYYIKGMEKDTDILFLPSWDWKKITRLHADICMTTAVENRVNVLKPTYDGISIAVGTDGRILDMTDTDNDGYENVHVVEFPIGSEETAVSKKTTSNSLYREIIATELLSLLICLVLLMGNRLESKEQSLRNRRYNTLLYLNILGLGSDCLSWALDGCKRLSSAVFLTSLFASVLTFAVIGEFLLFLNAYLQERNKDYHSSPIPLTVVYGLGILTTLVAGFSGILFTCKDGVYEEQSAYVLYVIINIILILFGYIKITRNRKELGTHGSIAAYLYLSIPMISAFINTFVSDWSFIYPSITISLLIIYVMLQSDRFDRINLEKQLNAYHAVHDELTDLNNRRAYDEQLGKLSQSDGTIGVIFSDLNNLKYTNDHFGHAAGDKLLIDFTNTLCNCFRREEIFRISGDEFVVLLPDLSESTFHTRMMELEQKITTENSKTACIGGAYGKRDNINTLIQEAEARMYDQKTVYHRTHPR